ncbi:hypothetical protein G9A89_005499 [Geosiphon pyriformis]|nr:hypothetical protein G9A89_005499 [Geosiphon pyriformis]
MNPNQPIFTTHRYDKQSMIMLKCFPQCVCTNTILLVSIAIAGAICYLLISVKNVSKPKNKLNEPPMVPYWIPIIGSAVTMGMNPIAFYRKYQKKYGDYYTFLLFGKKLVTCLGAEGNNFFFNAKTIDVSAEEAYKSLTVPVFGKGVVYDVHNSVLMQQKKFVKSGLSIDNLRAYVPIIFKETEDYFQRWSEKSGVENIYKSTAELTIMTASRCLLGDEVREKLDESFAQIYHDLDGGFTPINFIFEDLPLPSYKLRDKAHVRMRNFFLDIMNSRREANKTDGSDIMTYLMKNCFYKDGRPLSDQETAHIMIALLMAGQHTSSTTTAWALIYLAENPELFEKLRQEQIKILGSLTAPLTLEAIRKMGLHDNVVRETLRLRPPITHMIRKVIRDLHIPGTQYIVPKGHFIQAVPAVSQRAHEYFSNPEKFDPYRWIEYDMQNKERDDDIVDYGFGVIHTTSAKSAYLPFGAGRHRCIGETFAYVQIKTIIATVVRIFDMKLHNNKFPACDFTTMIVQPVKPMVDYIQNAPSGKVVNCDMKEEKGASETISEKHKGNYTDSAKIEYWGSGIRLTAVSDLPDEENFDCVTLRELLSTGDLDEMLQLNYMVELDFLMSCLASHQKTTLPTTIIHGLREDKDMIKKRAEQYPNVKLHSANLPIAYGTHHSKAMLLFYSNQTLRVIICTANAIASDWGKKTQGVYMTPALPRKKMGRVIPAAPFELDLLEYLSAYGGILKDFRKKVAQYDFSEVKAILIGSIPGYHSGPNKNKWGHMRLRTVLGENYKIEREFLEESTVIAQCSSIGSLGAKENWFVNEFAISLFNGRNQEKSSNTSLKLVFPTVNNVRNSLEGWAAGGSIPFDHKNYLKQKTWMNKYLCRWKGFDSGRDQAMPHIKTYTRLRIPTSESSSNLNSPNSPTNASIGWHLLTSSNLSKAAWGQLQKNDSQLMIRSYELGVLLLPGLFQDEQYDSVHILNATVQNPFPTLPLDVNEPAFISSRKLGKNVDDDKSVSKPVLLVPLRLPYDVPLTPYHQDDECWTWNLPRHERDSLGNRCVNSGLWNQTRFILYATWDKIVIYNGFFEHVQTIGLKKFVRNLENLEEHQIVSVELSERDGKIAITIESNVLIFEPEVDDKNTTTRWNLLNILKHDLPIFCTAWNPNDGYLWVGGGTIVLWKYRKNSNIVDWSKIWEQKAASNVIMARLSPDCKLLATTGEHDRTIKVWWGIYSIDGGDSKFSFYYLSHPRAVTDFTWRKSSLQQTKADENILYTMCRDGICRIWAATNSEEPQTLYICTVVDPSQFLVALSDISEENAPEIDPCTYTPIHWIQPIEFIQAVNLAYNALVDGQADKSHASRQIVRLKNLAADKSDLLYQVQRDGSMIIWAIQHLNSRPRRVPRVLVLLRMAQALLPSDVTYFSGSTLVFHDHLGVKSRSLIMPAELSIVAQNPHGRINCYSISLADFFDNTRLTTRLYLKHSWTGHHSNIERLNKAPATNHLASISNIGEVVVWSVENPQYGTRMSHGMSEQSPVWLDSGIKLACLLPGGRYLAAYYGPQIILFLCGRQDTHSYQIAQLEGYDPNYELCLLFAFPQHQTNQASNTVSFVAGISLNENTVFCWKIDQNESDNQFPIVHFISRESLPVSSNIVMAVSANQWAGAHSRCHKNPRDSNTPVLLTLTDDGFVTYWRSEIRAVFDQDIIEDIWSPSLQIDIGSKRCALIKCGPNDRVALVKESRREVSIWESITPRLPATKEYALESREPIVDVDWLFTCNAELVVAIATAQNITIHAQLRKVDVSVLSLGIMLFEVDIPKFLPDSVSALSWGSGGTLIFTNGNQLRCYNKWMSEKSFQQVSRITGFNKKLPTLFHVIDHLNGPFPHHHPTLLLQYLLWGKMDLVKLILVYLYNYLKLLKDAEKPITRIPPVPFDKLFNELEQSITSSPKHTRYRILFDSESEDDGPTQEEIFDFNHKMAEFLSEQLTRVSLPDLSSIEQAQLLALVHTIIQVEGQKRSLDQNGVRYVIFMRRYHYLNRSVIASTLRAPGLSYRDMTWAMHSESQDLLLEYSIAASGGKFLWKDARIHGVFLWLRNIEMVRQQMEIIARNQYLSKEERDPSDAALFYIALRKKKLLLALWRTANHHPEKGKIMHFLANDFEEQRWKTAALKNAYALLGKQRYEYAASFFLLGDRLKDAVNVCLKNLDDFQLAVAICRVYEGDDGPVLKSIIEGHILPLAVGTGDRWLAHMAFWIMNQRDRAIQATMLPLEKLYEPKEKRGPSTYDKEIQDAALIILYKQLKEKTVQTLRGAAEISMETEYSLVLGAIFAYERMGCPLLALHVLKTWVFTFEPNSSTPEKMLHLRKRSTILDVPLPSSDAISSGVMNFDDWSWNEPTSRGSDNLTSYTRDIFSQEPMSLESPSLGSFSHKPQSLSWKSNSPHLSNTLDIFASEISGNHEDGSKMIKTITLLDDKDLSSYKFTLVKRLSQQILDGVGIIVEDTTLFAKSLYYTDYLDQLHKGLRTICDTIGMPFSDIEETLITYP